MTVRKYRFEEIAFEIENDILKGKYRTGQKLPSVRDLKSLHNTSISTIQKAYEHLLIKELVRSEPKSGYFVAKEQFDLDLNATQKPVSMVVRDSLFQNNLSQITSLRSIKSELSEFNVAQPGDFFIPHKLILRTMQEVIREKGARLLRYYHSNGSEELREEISRRAAFHQTNIPSSELIVTDGALQALYIALATTCSPGDIVAVESPCVFSILEVIRMQKLKVIEIPIGLRDGFDIDFLKKAFRKYTISAVIVTPNFQNPTGNLLSDEQKKALLFLIQEHGIPLIENDMYGDLHYDGRRPTNVRSFDESGLVLTYSSYSKSLAAGIRAGWLSPGKYFEKAEQIKYALGSTVSPIYQEVILKLISSNSYDRHCRRFRTQLARQFYYTQDLLRTSFPSTIQISHPKGGSNLWVKMDDKLDMELFYRHCLNIGIRFTPGYTFSFSKTYNQFFRLVFSEKYSPTRENAIRLAGEAARQILI